MTSDLLLSIEPTSITRHSVGAKINFAVLDGKTLTAPDITSYTTVKLIAWLKGAQDAKKFSKDATKDVGAGGTGFYTIASGDFDVAPRWYQVQLYLAKTGEERYTQPVDFYVRPGAKV